jgi:hypothetical protein
MTVNTMMRTISYPVRALAKPLIHMGRKSQCAQKDGFHTYIDRFLRAVKQQKWKSAFDIWRKLPECIQTSFVRHEVEHELNFLHWICTLHPPHKFLRDMAELLAPMASRAIEKYQIFPLHLAAMHGSCDAVVQTILEWYPPAVKRWDVHGNTPLMYACAIEKRTCRLSQKVKIIRRLLYAAPEMINRINEDGMRAISFVHVPSPAPLNILATMERLRIASRHECNRVKRELERQGLYEEKPFPFPRFTPWRRPHQERATHEPYKPPLSKWEKEEQLHFDKIERAERKEASRRAMSIQSDEINEEKIRDVPHNNISRNNSGTVRQLFNESSVDEVALEIKTHKEALGSSYDTQSLSDDDDSSDFQRNGDDLSDTSKEDEYSLVCSVDLGIKSISVEDYSVTFLFTEDDESSYLPKEEDPSLNDIEEVWQTEDEEDSFDLDTDSDGIESCSLSSIACSDDDNSIEREVEVNENENGNGVYHL